MAVITIDHEDLNQLLNEDVTLERLEQEGSMLGILFEPGEDGSIDVEVEPNRPDLLSVEGVARALNGFFEHDTGAVKYPVQNGSITVTVDEAVDAVRPFIACAVVRGLDMTPTMQDSLIQLQEKLTETYGRKRAKIAIGVHDLAGVKPPFTYTASAPDEIRFVPLNMDTEHTLGEILDRHEKGREYGWILDDADVYPVITDADGVVLSFPPIINGTTTEVTRSTEDVFLDVTGTSRKEVETALNILVAALYERGGTIESVTVDGTDFPDMAPETYDLDPEYVRDVSGLHDLSPNGIADCLTQLNYEVSLTDGLEVGVPAYRADIMHAYDLIEDVVIGYGYDNVEPEIPDLATIGGQTAERVFIDHLRELLIGAGAQEVMTFILSNKEKLFDNMALEPEDIVEMANPLTEDYAVVRHRLLPSLMEVLGSNQHNRYPQRLFEVGLCSEIADTPSGAADHRRLAYVAAHSDADFAEARGVLQSVCAALGKDLTVEECEHPSFTEKRRGTVLIDGEACGVIGELSAEIRDNWGIDVSVVGFELVVEQLHG